MKDEFIKIIEVAILVVGVLFSSVVSTAESQCLNPDRELSNVLLILLEKKTTTQDSK
jgi:hypothetical protein